MTKIAHKISIIIVIILCLFVNVLHSQTLLIAKFSPIAVHPFKEVNSHLFENKIDANGIFVTEPCFIFGTETFLREDYFSMRFLLGGLGDAVSKPALFFHAGLKFRFLQIWRSSFSIGLGGNAYGRERWSSIDDYVPEKGWAKNGTWEYALGFMGELEYLLILAQRHDVTLSLIYGHQPKTFTLALGYRFWLSTEIKHPKPCGSCPFGQKKKNRKGRWHF